MKYTTEKEIARYPSAKSTGRTMTVDGVVFQDYRILNRNIWRTPDQYSIEIGRHGAENSTYYVKIHNMILEVSYPRARSAAQAGIKALAKYVSVGATAVGI